MIHVTDIKQKFLPSQKPLVLDGAVGSILMSAEYERDEYLWSSYSNIKHPEKVIDLHKEYIKNGADIITTNSFRTNPIAVKRSKKILDIRNFVNTAVGLARQAAKENDEIIIAGSNAPAEDCYQTERGISQSELENNHKMHINFLYEAGCDLILNETQSHLDEILIICSHCSQHNIPFIISLFVDDNLKILSGESLNDMIELIKTFSPLAIGFNCISNKVFGKIASSVKLNFPWGVYLNCGSGQLTDEIISCGVTPQDYVKCISPFINEHTRFVGSCCGSGCLHTKEIRKLIDEIY